MPPEGLRGILSKRVSYLSLALLLQCFADISILNEQYFSTLVYMQSYFDRKVIDCFLTVSGKDVTHKLYSLNEHLTGGVGVGMGGGGRRRHPDVSNVPVDDASAAAYQYRNALCRSVSVDAVYTGFRGHVRSSAFTQERTSSDREYSPILPPHLFL